MKKLSSFIILMVISTFSYASVPYTYQWTPSNIGDQVEINNITYTLTAVPLSLNSNLHLTNKYMLVLPIDTEGNGSIDLSYTLNSENTLYGYYQDNFLVYTTNQNDGYITGYALIQISSDYEIDSKNTNQMNVDMYRYMRVLLRVGDNAVKLSVSMPCANLSVPIQVTDNYAQYMDWDAIKQCSQISADIAQYMNYVRVSPYN